MKVKFEDIQPYSRIKDNIIVNRYGDVAACFLFQGKEVFSLDKEGLEQNNSDFASSFNYLDENYVIQKQDVFLKTKYFPNEPENDTYMSRAFVEHFRGKEYLKQYSYLYLIRTETLSINRNYGIQRNLGKADKASTIRLAEFEVTVNQFKNYLTQRGYYLKELTEEQIFKLADGYFNCFENGVNYDIEFTPEFKIGGKYASLFALNHDENQPLDVAPYFKNEEFKTEDNQIFSDFNYTLGFGLKCEHVLNQFIFIDNQRDWVVNLEKRSKELASSLQLGSRTTNLKYYENQENFIASTIDSESPKKICRYHNNVIFWADTMDELKVLKGQVKGSFIDLGITPHVASNYDLRYLFLASAPGNGGTMPVDDTIIAHTETASCFMLKESAIDRSKGNPSTHGIMLVDRLTNIPAYRDMWFKPYETKLIDNRNALVIGKSGGGKSSTSIELLRQYLELGFLITVIDIGASFELLAKEYDGNYLVYREGMSLGVNPFDLKDGKITTELLEYLATFTFVLWKPKEVLEDEKRQTLELIILAYYGAKMVREADEQYYIVNDENSSGTLPKFYEWVKNNESVIEEIILGRTDFFDIKSFLISLSQFVTGKFSNLFTATSTTKLIDPNKPLTVFELNNIKDHPTLFPIFAMLIDYMSTNVLWKNKRAQKIFFYDECHKILEKPGMGTNLRFQFKTLRKYDAGVWIAIQQLSDLDVANYNGNLADAILGNCDIKLIMRHAKDLVDSLAQRLKFNDHQISLLKSINNNFSGKYPYTEHLNILGSDFKVMRTSISPKQRVIMMSEFKDKAELYSHVEKEGDWYKGIESFIKLKKW